MSNPDRKQQSKLSVEIMNIEKRRVELDNIGLVLSQLRLRIDDALKEVRREKR